MDILLSDSTLLKYNQEGLIPAPKETVTDFIERAQTCLHLKKNLTENLSLQLPFEINFTDSIELLQSAGTITKTLFDIQPTWLPIFYTNYQLARWHGGCAWIFQLEEQGPKTAFLQLRKVFSTGNKYLGMYHRNELVAHECAHVGRMMFNEARFEEVLAYRTATSRWRKWWGPLVESANESFFFMLLLIMIIGLDGYFVLTQNFEMYLTLFWLKVIPIGVLLIGILRLWQRHCIFNKCLIKLQKVLKNAETADHVIYRLTDEEISTFAKIKPEEIISYTQQEKSLRWRLLNLAYFTD